MTVLLVVTYEFDAANSTEATNSLLIPYEMPSPMGNSAMSISRFSRELLVGEPGPITLLQSAFRLNYQTTGNIWAMYVRAGSQSYREYISAGNVICGMLCVQQRLDAGSGLGAGLMLAKGSNTITLDFYNTDLTPDRATNLCGVIILNYASGVHSDGIGAHSHTVFRSVRPMSTTPIAFMQMGGVTPGIPESDYWLVAAGYLQRLQQRDVFDRHVGGSRRVGSAGRGWRDVYCDTVISQSELGEVQVYSRARDEFRRHPGDRIPTDWHSTRHLWPCCCRRPVSWASRCSSPITQCSLRSAAR